MKQGRRTLALLSAMLLAIAAAPSQLTAQGLPQPAAVATEAEADVLRDLGNLVSTRSSEADALTGLNGLLTRLPRPTPLRGIVQTFRADLLRRTDRMAEAIDAAEEAARLLPAATAPLLLAAYIEAYRDNAETAAAYLLRASDLDRAALVAIDDYELGNILSRLSSERYPQMRQRLVRRLFETGWRGESVVLRSRLARETIQNHLADGNVEGARALVPQLVRPTDAYDLLTLRTAEPIWADIETWAGPQQRSLWQIHLGELRARWASTRNHERARDYVYALKTAHHYRRAATDLLPLFDNPRQEEDYDLLWVAAPFTSTLAFLDRWDEADALLTRLLTIWPAGSDANALNLLANRGRLRHYRGDHQGAVADLRAAIADGTGRGGVVSSAALRPMHRTLACALHELGRDTEAIPSIDFVRSARSPVTVAELNLCLGRIEAARDALLDGLEYPDHRPAIIDFLQPDPDLPLPSAIARQEAERLLALQADPVLLAAIAPYGRILPYRVGAGAPGEQMQAPGQ